MNQQSGAFKPSMEPPANQNPILRARWVLDKYEAKEQVFGEGEAARSSMRITFFFRDVVPLEVVEPYPFPIANVFINYANPQTSRGEDRWSVFAASGRRVFGRPLELDELVGKEQEWAQLPGKIRMPDENQKWGVVETPCWQIVSVTGISAASGAGSNNGDIFVYLAEQAEGKKEDEYYIALVADQKVTNQASIVGQITERKLVDTLITMKFIERDPDGVLHKVAEA